MLTFATFFYGILASFVVASINNNRRARRAHPPILTLFGWGMMSFSGVFAILLLGFAAVTTGATLNV